MKRTEMKSTEMKSTLAKRAGGLAASLLLFTACPEPTPPDAGAPGDDGGAVVDDGGAPGGDGGAPVDDGGAPGDDGGAPGGDGGTPGGDGGTPGGDGGAPADDGGPSIDGGAPVLDTWDDVSPATAEGLCRVATRGTLNLTGFFTSSLGLAFSRCSAETLAQPIAWLGDQEETLRAAAASCVDPPADSIWARLIERGHVTVNEAAIASCQAEGRTLRQTLTGEVTPEEPVDANCEGLTTGALAAGAACISDLECSGDLLCDLDLGTGLMACQAPAAANESCRAHSVSPRRCGEGLECVEDTCLPRGGLGDPCSSTDASCADDLVCDSASSTCAAPAAEGQSCASVACEAELSCDPGTQLCVTNLADGAPCDDSVGCAATCSVCRPEAPGSATLRCLDRGDVGDGCATLDDCREGTFCDVAQGSCAAQRGEGGSCASDFECQSGLDCVEGTCQAEETPACAPDCTQGQACTNDDVCAVGLFCSYEPGPEGTCQPLPEIGQPCPEGRCADGAWCEPDEGVCAAKLAEGAECTSDDACVSGSCYVPGEAAAGTCTPVAESCLTTKSTFPLLVLFSLLWAPGLRRLSRRAASRGA